MFVLYASNRLEHLALNLARIAGEPLDPMIPETILVQSGGMQRWLSMQLAREHGICANVRFPFPVAFVHDLARRLLPDLPRDNALSREHLLWRVAGCLPGLLQEPEFAPLARYLADPDALKQVQLAEKIAYLFDEYLIFRPQWAKVWEQGGLALDPGRAPDEIWQARLWREAVRGLENEHRAALLTRSLDALANLEPDQVLTLLPPHLSVFGISTLPPQYLDLLLALARHIPVHFFLLSPCRHYWGDLLTKCEQRRQYCLLTAGGPALARPEDATPLAGLGALGRDFHEMLAGRDLEPLPLYSDFPAPENGLRSLLHSLQHDLLELTPPDDHALTDQPADQSIQIHCCHSPMREMEVLRDQILDLLQRDPTLQPKDILVMNPDIDAYASVIQAVFGNPEEGRLPFAIADRRPSLEARHVRFFLDLMTFGQHRFEASHILDLLEAPILRQALDLDETDCARVAQWVNASRIRWGLNQDFKAAANLPPHAQNTWESGLARLFLGYMTGTEHDPLYGVAPLGPVHSDDQRLLGCLAGFLDRLHRLWTDLNTPGHPDQWQDRLHWLLDTFFPQDRDTTSALLPVRMAITELTQAISAHAPMFQADSRTMLHLLRSRLDESGTEGNFLASGLTFCSLRPMRAIPFRVICLTGLSAFPGQNTRPGFDLIAASPRPGDRTQRDDDRYLFLESLISARDTLILSYPGLSQTDNSEAPPSVLISELLDYLNSRYRLDARKPSEVLLTRHRLQAFHPDYFRPDSALFSYSRPNFQAAQALCGQSRALPFFPVETNQDHPHPSATLELDELTRFLAHPVRHLLKSLDIHPEGLEDDIPDEEPLNTPDGLDGYAVQAALLQTCLNHADAKTHLTAWQALPPGPGGQDACADLCAKAEAHAQEIQTLQGNAKPDFHALDIALPDCHIRGRIATYQNSCMVTFRAGKLKGSDMLGLWARYLAARSMGLDIRAAHVAQDQTFYAPNIQTDQARELLADLAQLYATGMTRPLPFFPHASLAYAKTWAASQDRTKSLGAALKKWTDEHQTLPERHDPSLALAFRDTAPDWNAFMTVTEKIYGPLLGLNPEGNSEHP